MYEAHLTKQTKKTGKLFLFWFSLFQWDRANKLKNAFKKILWGKIRCYDPSYLSICWIDSSCADIIGSIKLGLKSLKRTEK